MKVGLTGGIASGKSTVTEILESLGAKIIDADKVAHQLMEPKKELWQKIIDAFGQKILTENEEIDRDKLGNLIFNDSQKKKKIDQLSHPIIISEIESRLETLEQDNQIIIADIPLLIEADLMDLFQEVWVVYVKKEIQINRLMNRDNIDRKQAVAKIESQMSLKEKKKYADRIINNNGSVSQLEKQVKKIWREIGCGSV